MNKKCCNSDVYWLVLGRPADPLCTLLSAFLSRQHYRFSVCSSIYQVLVELESVSAGRQVFLVTRPATLMSQAAVFLTRRFPDVRLMGWIDSNETLSNCAAAGQLASPMTMVGSYEQLCSAVQSLKSACFQQVTPVPDTKEMEISDTLDPMEYKLCDDEMNALLGVE